MLTMNKSWAKSINTYLLVLLIVPFVSRRLNASSPTNLDSVQIRHFETDQKCKAGTARFEIVNQGDRTITQVKFKVLAAIKGHSQKRNVTPLAFQLREDTILKPGEWTRQCWPIQLSGLPNHEELELSAEVLDVEQ